MSLISVAYASTPGLTTAQSFVGEFNRIILFPVIALLFAVALLVFMWGCYLYIIKAGEPAARAEGQKHIMWGIIGMFIMLSAYAILAIAANTFGLNEQLNCADDPNASGCEIILNPFTGTGSGNTGGDSTGNRGGQGSGN